MARSSTADAWTSGKPGAIARDVPPVLFAKPEAREQHLALAGFSFLPIAISVVAVAVRIAIRIAVGVAVRVAVYRTNT